MSSLGINPVSPRAVAGEPVPPQTPAGKLTALWSSRACGVAVIAITFVAFAFTASAAHAQAPCPNEQLRAEQPYGLRLPDCRAYEMVSPLEKDDYDATSPVFNAARVSLSGEALAWESEGSFADAEGHQFLNQYISRRGVDGWSTQSITPPYTAYYTLTRDPYEAMAFTPELSEGVAATDVPLTSEALPEYENLYVADLTSIPLSYQLVTNGKPYGKARHQIAFSPPEAGGASTDLSHVVYTELEHVSEWVNGKLSLTSVTPEGEPMESAEAGGGQQPGRDNIPSRDTDSWRSVSADGTRVIFTGPDTNGAETPDRQLYVRENGASTVEVSKSQRSSEDPAGPQSARFQGASVDGSRVFFTSCAKLTDDSTASAGHGSIRAADCFPGEPETGNDLYEYDLETGVLTDLTVDKLTVEKMGDPNGAKVLGVADISENGSYVYFVAEGALTVGENAEGKEPVAEEPNLYVAHLENGSWTTRFVATLVRPTRYVGGGNGQEGGDSEDWDESPALNTVRETPDGTHLAFLSTRALTDYNNTDANTGKPDTEIFSYDALTEKLTCVSCNPSGAQPVGPSSWEERQEFPFALQGYTPRNYSENGGRLFFNSDDALVPHDSNGRQDVYEWEQEGEGSCNQASGCIFPISDVAGNYESFFLDASPSGNDVFFATEDQLVPADSDFHVDVYDARVGGGFPVSVQPPSCENGDSCKGPVSPQPGVFGAPASATFSGVGNLPISPPPVLKVSPKSAPKPLTRAQKLTKALKVCRGERSAKRREGCERAAQKRYGPVKAKRSVKR
jgi:hypothetical protein